MQPLVKKFADDGCLTFTRLVAPVSIEAARAEYERQWEMLAVPGEHEQPGKNVGNGRRMLPIQLENALLDPLIFANPLVAMILHEALGPDYLIDNVTCVTALPGAEAQHLHADHPDLFAEMPETRAQTGCYAATLAIPLIDLSSETGTTELHPGSHLSRDQARRERPYVQAGGGYLIDYRLQHRGLANVSAKQRPILYIVYARPWFTDTVNFRRWPKINISAAALDGLRPADRRLFRRLAAKGALDRTEDELMAGGD